MGSLHLDVFTQPRPKADTGFSRAYLTDLVGCYCAVLRDGSPLLAVKNRSARIINACSRTAWPGFWLTPATASVSVRYGEVRIGERRMGET
jgi:hypothetical protein